MQTRIHYRHITHSEELSRNIEDYFDEKLRFGKGHEDLQVDLFFSKATPHTKANTILFECHLRARAPWLSGELIVKDRSEDFWQLVTGCALILHKNIVRDLEFRRGRKKQGGTVPASTA